MTDDRNATTCVWSLFSERSSRRHARPHTGQQTSLDVSVGDLDHGVPLFSTRLVSCHSRVLAVKLSETDEVLIEGRKALWTLRLWNGVGFPVFAANLL